MLSVIIPAYNAEKSIATCLDALISQDYPGDFEIIVVDDGSTDSTAKIADGYEKVRVLRQDNAGPAEARNRGANEASGDIILFTDSDCEPFVDWISQMVKPFLDNPEIIGVKGIYKTKQNELIAKFVQAEYEDKYDTMRKYKYIDFVDTYSAGFKKDIFLSVNGYDTSFPVACAEDVDLSFRLSVLGHKMVFAPNAVVYHLHPNTLLSYLKKKYKFAFWRLKAVKKNPNKAVKDSHTPSTMKIQIMLVSIIIGLIPLSFNNLMFVTVPILIYFFTTLPFLLKIINKDLLLCVFSPFLLFLRSCAQLLGLIGGVIQGR